MYATTPLTDISAWSVLQKRLYERHAYTANHCLAVAKLSTAFARIVFPVWDEKKFSELTLGALLHDIGKLNISLLILDGTGQLTDKQFSEMKTHPLRGVKLVTDLGIFIPAQVLQVIKYHHESFRRGLGYPGELWGEDIPLATRIVSIADMFHALTSARSYKPAFSNQKAIEILRAEAGRKLDPLLVNMFVSQLAKQVA